MSLVASEVRKAVVRHCSNDSFARRRGQHVLLALEFNGKGFRHAIEDWVGIVESGTNQRVSNQFSGVGIKDGANVAKSRDMVLARLAYQAYMFVESKRWNIGSSQ